MSLKERRQSCLHRAVHVAVFPRTSGLNETAGADGKVLMTEPR